MSGLSKSVATGLRVGFVSAPAAPGARDRARDPRDHLEHPGHDDRDRLPVAGRRHRRPPRGGKRADASTRQSIARDVLAGLPLVGHPSSYFVWLPLAQDARADRIAALLARKRVSVATAEPYATSAPTPQALRLALGSADLDSLRRALGKVREAVEADPYR